MKIKILLLAFLLAALCNSDFIKAGPVVASPNKAPTTNRVFLPLVLKASGGAPVIRRINVPYFSGNITFPQMAVFWFGQVTPNDNYTDVRIGYNDTELYVNTTTIDKRLWYNPNVSSSSLTAWDSMTLYLSLDGNAGRAPSINSYRFDSQLNWFEPRSAYQLSSRGNGASWVTSNTFLTTASGWRSSTALDDDLDDKGWVMSFHIPFASLGLSGPPSPQTKWGVAVVAHNRDDAVGTPIADKVWPEKMSPIDPSTWGQLSFGLPTYTAPRATPGSTITIRNKLNGVVVKDGSVGGYSICGGNQDYWTQWGTTTWAFYNSVLSDFNIQNQSDVSDYPCFSKYYVTFPLNTLPNGKAILSATLTLHQMGNSTTPNQASIIQVMTVNEDFDPTTLTWNNAPLALENVSRASVDPVPPGCGSTIPWPCTPRTWDVSYAVAQAYATGKPLRLVFYSADDAYNSGKYFTASNVGDWDAAGRPSLDVLWGNPY